MKYTLSLILFVCSFSARAQTYGLSGGSLSPFGITQITNDDGSVTVINPKGPIVTLRSTSAGSGGGVNVSAGSGVALTTNTVGTNIVVSVRTTDQVQQYYGISKITNILAFDYSFNSHGLGHLNQLLFTNGNPVYMPDGDSTGDDIHEGLHSWLNLYTKAGVQDGAPFTGYGRSYLLPSSTSPLYTDPTYLWIINGSVSYGVGTNAILGGPSGGGGIYFLGNLIQFYYYCSVTNGAATVAYTPDNINWTNLGTITESALSGSQVEGLANFTNFSVPLGKYAIRITCTSGVFRMPGAGAGIINTNPGSGAIIASFNAAGEDLNARLAMGTNNIIHYLRGINPTVILDEQTKSLSSYSSYPAWAALVDPTNRVTINGNGALTNQATWVYADNVLIGSQVGTDANDPLTTAIQNITLHNVAVTNNWIYEDLFTPMSDRTNIVALGNNVDNIVHFNAQGNQYSWDVVASKMQLDEIYLHAGLPLGLQYVGASAINFSDAGTFSVTPTNVNSGVFAGVFSLSQLTPSTSYQLGVWLGATQTSDNWSLGYNGQANVTYLKGKSGVEVDLGGTVSGRKATAMFYPSGGIGFGYVSDDVATPDPGSNNVAIAGQITTSNLISSNGITSSNFLLVVGNVSILPTNCPNLGVIRFNGLDNALNAEWLSGTIFGLSNYVLASSSLSGITILKGFGGIQFSGPGTNFDVGTLPGQMWLSGGWSFMDLLGDAHKTFDPGSGNVNIGLNLTNWGNVVNNGTGFFGVGSGLTGLTAANLSGLVPTVNQGSGTANAGTALYGDQTYKAITNLTTSVTAPVSITAGILNLRAITYTNWVTNQADTQGGVVVSSNGLLQTVPFPSGGGGGGGFTGNASQFNSLGGSTNIISGATVTNLQNYGATNVGITIITNGAGNYSLIITNSGGSISISGSNILYSGTNGSTLALMQSGSTLVLNASNMVANFTNATHASMFSADGWSQTNGTGSVVSLVNSALQKNSINYDFGTLTTATFALAASSSSFQTASPLSASGTNIVGQGLAIFTNGYSSYRSNGLAPYSITAPASGATYNNTNNCNVEVYIDNSGVTGTAIKKNGTQIFSSVIGDVTLQLQTNETFSITYTIGTPVITISPY